MANLGQLVVNLEANIARFTSDMGRASQTVEQTMGRMNAAADMVKTVLGAVGVALSVDALGGEANRAIDALAGLDDMAQKTGSSVEMLSKLSKVAAFTGTDLGAVDAMLVKLSKNLNDVDESGSKTAKALSAIGISTDDLKGKDAAQVFVDITNKLQGYEDGAGKVALVTDLMGKSAADLLPFMNDVSESIDKVTGDSAEAAAAAAAYQDQLGLVRVKYDDIAKSIVEAALPAANDFIGALGDMTSGSNTLTNTTSVDNWADDVAVGLARVVDVAVLLPRMLSAISGSFKVVAADIEFVATAAGNLTPANIARSLANGRNPADALKAALAERNAIVEAANQKYDDLWNQPADRLEQNMLARIAGRSDKEMASGADALAGMVPSAGAPRARINYGSTKSDTTASGGPARFSEAELDVSARAAARMVELANDETFALRNTIDATLELQDADARRIDEKMRAMARSDQDAESIRLSLMTEMESEQFAHDERLEQLRVFGSMRLENELTANALIEAETQRHEQAIADMQRAGQLQSLGAMGNTADLLYNMLKQSGEKQSALAKAAFIASKAIAVAEIIMQTNVAAAKAKGQLGIFGLPQSAIILATGYAQAGMVAGMAIASAEGGYDIPAGTNPVTQLHEKEMVLPKAQAEVIRGLAARGGTGGSGVTINSSPTINIDSRTDQQEVRKIVSMGVAQGNADLVDKLSRAGRI